MLGPRFSAALTFASELHGTQSRKGTTIPYISHLLAVCAIVLENGGDEDQAIAAVLHDSIEDQWEFMNLTRIKERFGDRVAHIVRSCTDVESRPKPPWRERKEKYIASINEKDEDAVLVSLSDKVHNARSILLDYKFYGERVWERFKGGREGSLWYYRALVEAFRPRGHRRLFEELESTVTQLEGMATGANHAGEAGNHP